MNHLRLAFRRIINQRVYALLAIGTLSVGIGSMATCFSAVNTLLFRPIPAATEAARMVTLNQTRESDESENIRYKMGFSYVDATVVRERSTQLSALWLYTDLTVILEGDTSPWRFLATRISAGAFTALGVTPQLGRNFTVEDYATDAASVAVISDKAWTERFDRDPEILNTSVEINGVSTRIVGIMPEGWRYPQYSDVWMPLRMTETDSKSMAWDQPGFFFFGADGLLAPNATLTGAQIELEAIAKDLAETYPETNRKVGITIDSWRNEQVKDTVYFTLLLFGAGIAIFLIACANIANLQLSRGSERGPEIAVRLAMGASRGQIFRQLVIENMVLGLLGAIVGGVVGLWGVDWLKSSLNIDKPFWLNLDLDWRVSTFTALCGFLASFIFGLAPALRDSRTEVSSGLKESSRTGLDQGPFGQRLRNGIVIVEIALALVLLVGAGLMTRSFFKLTAVDPGYDAQNVLTFRVGFPLGYAGAPDEVNAFFDELPRRLERLPEVTHAGAVSQLPTNGMNTSSMRLLPDGQGDGMAEIVLGQVALRTATAGYFAAMDIPLVVGRDFAADRHAEIDHVAIVDAAFASAVGLTPEELIGRSIRSKSDSDNAESTSKGARVIGIVGSVQHSLQQAETIPTVYFVHHQDPPNFMTVALRSTVDPETLAGTIANEVLGVNKGMPIYDVLSMEQVTLRSVWQDYFFSRVFLCAGVIAVVLACVGIYGVMTFAVTMRRHEIGLRMALGAPASEVVGEVVRKGLYLVVIGLGAGVIAAILLANLLAGSLYGITPHDPPTFIIVPTLLAAVALAACYLSSRRATRINPMAAMRAE